MHEWRPKSASPSSSPGVAVTDVDRLGVFLCGTLALFDSTKACRRWSARTLAGLERTCV